MRPTILNLENGLLTNYTYPPLGAIDLSFFILLENIPPSRFEFFMDFNISKDFCDWATAQSGDFYMFDYYSGEF